MTPDDASNRLLHGLRANEYDRLTTLLESIRFPKNRILHEAGDPIRQAYFLTSGIVSLLAITEEGQTIEIATVGNEGFIGIPLIHRVDLAPYRAITQTAVTAFRIEADSLRSFIEREGKLEWSLLRYAQLLDTQIVQSLVCHLFHGIGQRLSRYLLVVSDCLQSVAFDITQEHIANMLGKDRSQVGVAAASLREKGLLDYQRGRITILDQTGLRNESCECYGIVKDYMTNFLND